MTMLDIHANALDGAQAVYHKFLLTYKKCNDRVVYGFVEGKECPMFYRGHIEHDLPPDWQVQLFEAGGKDNVFEIFEKFNWGRFSPKRISFFIDRDLTEFLQEKNAVKAKNIYITDDYSIENNAVNHSTLMRILHEIFNLTDLAPNETKQIKKYFDASLKTFCTAVCPIMAQIILWRRNGMRPCLNDIKLEDFFFFEKGMLKLKNRFRNFMSRVNNTAKYVSLQASSYNDILKAKSEFINLDGHKRFIRGKYLMWFIVEFSKKTHSSIHVLFSRYKKPPSTHMSMGQKNAIHNIAPRTRCPKSLKKFIIQNYLAYIKELR